MISKEKNHGTTFHENVIDYTEIKKNRVKKIGLYNRHYFYTLKQVIPPTYSSLLICNRADNNDSHRGYYLGGVFSKRIVSINRTVFFPKLPGWFLVTNRPMCTNKQRRVG